MKRELLLVGVDPGNEYLATIAAARETRVSASHVLLTQQQHHKSSIITSYESVVEVSVRLSVDEQAAF